TLALVAHGGVENRHRLTRGIVDGVAALLAAHHDVLDAHVGEGAAHHDVVVAATGAVGVEVGRPYLVLDEVDAGGTVALDRAGGGDVVGGDAVLEQPQHARIDQVLDGARLGLEALEVGRVLHVGGARVPAVGEAGLGLAHGLPLLVAHEHGAVALGEHVGRHTGAHEL